LSMLEQMTAKPVLTENSRLDGIIYRHQMEKKGIDE